VKGGYPDGAERAKEKEGADQDDKD
jgi:hypothetical protein